VFVDSQTWEFEAVRNLASDATGGAGIQAAQTVSNYGAHLVVTGNVGPNAYQALSAVGIPIVTGATGTVREAVEVNKTSQKTASGPSVNGHHGKRTQSVENR
jgi:predicted Fe-Mo cluster-binding NifX family protein